MSHSFASLVATLTSAGKITDQDTLAVRQAVWPDGVLQPEEAEALFALNAACADRSAAWDDFFLDAMTHLVVRQMPPVGYVNDENAAWLMARIDHDGKLDSAVEFELLVRILEVAKNAPDSLKDYALAQVEKTVLTGTGPTRGLGAITPGRIDEAEVKLLRRLLFAHASDGNMRISAAEAEFLFRLKDATLGADNAPEWKLLFVQCIANHLMAHDDVRPISVEQASALDAGLKSHDASVGRKMSFRERFRHFLRALRKEAGPTHAEYQSAVAASRAVTAEEAAWLKAKISVDDTIDDLEKAVLAFIVEENGSLPDVLADLQKSA